MTTPAERLAAKKPWRRPSRNGVTLHKKVWYCGLREVREELKISMRDVAKAVGLSLTAYWQIEHGTDPMLSNAVKLAAFFGKPVEELWSKRRATRG